MTPLEAEIERLRARTHELQERHDQEASRLRKELKTVSRERDFWRTIWWERVLPSPALGDIHDAYLRVRPMMERMTPLLEQAFREIEDAMQ